ncbi:MAG: enoyl-CoA hydratase/isomerase family protein [Planctomycetes bacterium]|nr:enoyl-CoA hydratase/isomerase family protein [Planctomycetota bacterium]
MGVFRSDPNVRGIILTGEGMMFCAGADLKEIMKIQNANQALEVVRKGHEFCLEIEAMKLPVIAAINGPCLGGGNELAMACHIRVASDKARFGQPEINFGLIPGLGGSQRLPRLVGRAKALELLLTGDMLSAQEAKALGLVNQVVPEQMLLKTATGIAKKIAAKGKVAVGAILDAVNRGMAVPIKDALAIESELFGKICETEDMKEGVSAFVEKRQPKFKDR